MSIKNKKVESLLLTASNYAAGYMNVQGLGSNRDNFYIPIARYIEELEKEREDFKMEQKKCKAIFQIKMEERDAKSFQGEAKIEGSTSDIMYMLYVGMAGLLSNTEINKGMLHDIVDEAADKAEKTSKMI